MVPLRRQLAPNATGDVEGVKVALQTALRLEHATIPPYLYALYSLKQGYNFEIVEGLRSIVLEEMSHMALVCNVLNALNCEPKIDHRDFIPRYPSRLPGSVEKGLIVPLRPFSKSLVRRVFAVIEEPEDPRGKKQSHSITVGQFYRRIREALGNLTQPDFTGNPEWQLQTGFGPLQRNAVTGAASAAAAIGEIVEQGEGATRFAFDEEGEIAHYYRLVEMYYGRKLVVYVNDPLPPSHSFDSLKKLCQGHRIEFDPTGVWPAISNPSATLYARNQRVSDVNREFNRTYTRLLGLLQAVFSGAPDRLAIANTLMTSLKEMAMYLMSSEIRKGVTAGPTFEYTS